MTMPSVPINPDAWTTDLAATQSAIFNRFQTEATASRLAASQPAQSNGYDHVASLQSRQQLQGGRPLTQAQTSLLGA